MAGHMAMPALIEICGYQYLNNRKVINVCACIVFDEQYNSEVKNRTKKNSIPPCYGNPVGKMNYQHRLIIGKYNKALEAAVNDLTIAGQTITKTTSITQLLNS